MVSGIFCPVSRRKWISMKDKFNNFQTLFAENSDNIIALFNEAINNLPNKENVIVRLYGEIFGGKYGDECDTVLLRPKRDLITEAVMTLHSLI